MGLVCTSGALTAEPATPTPHLPTRGISAPACLGPFVTELLVWNPVSLEFVWDTWNDV